MAGVDIAPYMRPTGGYGARERAVSASDDEVQVGRWQEHPFRVLEYSVGHIEAVDQSPGDVAKQRFVPRRRRVVGGNWTARFEVVADRERHATAHPLTGIAEPDGASRTQVDLDRRVRRERIREPETVQARPEIRHHAT